MIKRFDRAVNKIFDGLYDYPRELLVLKLTLILLLLHVKTSWALHVPLRIICSFMLISDSLTKNKFLWTALAAVLVFINGLQWYIIDNHQYLITYWCIACCIAVYASDTFKVLKQNARLLLGLVFLFSVSWKFLGGEFLDGSFFEFTMLTDSRLQLHALMGGGLDQSILSENYRLYDWFNSNPELTTRIPLTSTAGLHQYAIVFSLLIILIEGLIAVAFLFSSVFKPFLKTKDFLLISFIVVTYFLVPVLGFGFTLTILGISQIDKVQKKLFGWYILCFILIQLTLIPFDKLLLKYLF